MAMQGDANCKGLIRRCLRPHEATLAKQNTLFKIDGCADPPAAHSLYIMISSAHCTPGLQYVQRPRVTKSFCACPSDRTSSDRVGPRLCGSTRKNLLTNEACANHASAPDKQAHDKMRRSRRC